MALSPEQHAQWEREGYLVLPGFFADAQVTALAQAWDRAWKDRRNVTVDNITVERRMKLGDVPPDMRRRDLFKLNDLYLEFEDVRAAVLDPRIVGIVNALLGHRAVLCNTLSLERSTQQQNHVDSLYMTPRTPTHLAATWVALEDVHPDAGPLRFVPGSHKIPPYTFADGTHHATVEEHAAADAHFARGMAERGLKPQLLLAKKGDVFLWHADLVHGGEPIVNRALTRRSFVSHFYTEPDARAWNVDLVPHGEAFWIHRGPQPVSAPPPPPPPLPLRYQLLDKVYFGVKRATPRSVADAARRLAAGFVR